MECQAIILYYHNYPEVQLTNTSYDSNEYFVSSLNSHIDVASYINNENVALVDVYSITGSHHASSNSGYYMQKPMSTLYILSFNDTSGIYNIHMSILIHVGRQFTTCDFITKYIIE
jgi:hypothetical protein